MKFLLIAAFVAVAAASPARLILPEPAGPTPVVDDSDSSISVGPAIINDNDFSPISVGPAIINDSDFSPISVGPAIIDNGIVSSAGSPLVQVIINVKSAAPAAVAEIPETIEEPIEEIEPSPVIIAENPEEIIRQPIIDAPIFPSPAIVMPDPLILYKVYKLNIFLSYFVIRDN